MDRKNQGSFSIGAFGMKGLLNRRDRSDSWAEAVRGHKHTLAEKDLWNALSAREQLLGAVELETMHWSLRNDSFFPAQSISIALAISIADEQVCNFISARDMKEGAGQVSAHKMLTESLLLLLHLIISS